jgi:pimeloyl-ACP methyl ester carboxylesterase
MATVVLPEITRALYPFKSNFLTLGDGKRMHYIDEGEGEVLVFVHDYPAWSFLYRAFIIYYAGLGYRCLAMDHIGYGLSDKPTSRRYYTLLRYIDNLETCLDRLTQTPVTLVMLGLGGPVGLGYTIRQPERVSRLVIMNSWAFQDTYTSRFVPLIKLASRRGIGELVFSRLNLVIGIGLQQGTNRRLSPAILAGYKAPFRDVRSRTALVQYPRMISTAPTHPSAPLLRTIEQQLPTLSAIPTLIVWGKEDPIYTPEVAEHWKSLMPRAIGPLMIEGSNHFVPEDNPEAVIQHLDAFLEKTPRPSPTV